MSEHGKTRRSLCASSADPLVECVHRGHVAIWHHDTGLIAGWGDTRRHDPAAERHEDDAGPAACGKRRGRCGGPVGGPPRAGLRLAPGAAIHTDMVTNGCRNSGLAKAICAAGRRCRRRGHGHAMIRAYGSRISGTTTARASTRVPDAVTASGRRAGISGDRPSRAKGRARRAQDLTARACDDMRSTDVPRRTSRCRWRGSRAASPPLRRRRRGAACVAGDARIGRRR
jgi:hypothetical protein